MSSERPCPTDTDHHRDRKIIFHPLIRSHQPACRASDRYWHRLMRARYPAALHAVIQLLVKVTCRKRKPRAGDRPQWTSPAANSHRVCHEICICRKPAKHPLSSLKLPHQIYDQTGPRAVHVLKRKTRPATKSVDISPTSTGTGNLNKRVRAPRRSRRAPPTPAAAAPDPMAHVTARSRRPTACPDWNGNNTAAALINRYHHGATPPSPCCHAMRSMIDQRLPRPYA